MTNVYASSMKQELEKPIDEELMRQQVIKVWKRAGYWVNEEQLKNLKFKSKITAGSNHQVSIVCYEDQEQLIRCHKAIRDIEGHIFSSGNRCLKRSRLFNDIWKSMNMEGFYTNDWEFVMSILFVTSYSSSSAVLMENWMSFLYER